MARFFIAVPTRNSARFLGQTLASLLESQPGDFDLHVHVQDGASTDGTLAVAEAWARRIAAGEVPDASRRRITIASARDAGLYDAVATAFDSVARDEPDVLGWLGSDDLLMPGALATIAKVFERFPEARWLTGRPQWIDPDGAWFSPWGIESYARRNIARGAHDGRSLPFVMQEGTFWRAALYREAGGLRRDLRLAGDFDLWRRFARTDDLVMCPFPLGAWRQRDGQASSDLAGYYREVERVLADGKGSGVEAEASSEDPALRYRPVLLERLFGRDWALRVSGLPFRPLEGFGPLEEPAAAEGLHGSFVRMRARRALLQVPLLEEGVPYRLALRLRKAHPAQRVIVRYAKKVVYEGTPRPAGASRSSVVAFTITPQWNMPVLSLEYRECPLRTALRWASQRLRGRAARKAVDGSFVVEDLAFERG
jgi:glycosyltransferase involved in cell wall biosynthesis